jgi:hypothetical protein
MSTLHKWKIKCIEEDKFVYTWSEDLPVICPNNHTDRTIDNDYTIIVESISKNNVIIEEPTTGVYQSTTKIFDIPSGITGDITMHDLELDIDMELWKLSIMSTEDMVNDEISSIYSPNQLIGSLNQEGIINSNEIIVSPETFNTNIVKGLEIILDDGITQINCGKIISIDKVNYKLTLSSQLTKNYNIGTLIRTNFYGLYNVKIILSNHEYVYGGKGVRSLKLSKDKKLCFVYKNNNGKSKKLFINLEYYYS